MNDIAIKKRLSRAKEKARNDLAKNGYKIILSDNNIFCFLAVRKKEIRMVKVVVGDITEEELRIVRKFESPMICTKEIWYRSLHQKDFEISEII